MLGFRLELFSERAVRLAADNRIMLKRAINVAKYNAECSKRFMLFTFLMRLA